MWHDDYRAGDPYPNARKFVGLVAIVMLLILGRAILPALIRMVFGGESSG